MAAAKIFGDNPESRKSRNPSNLAGAINGASPISQALEKNDLELRSQSTGGECAAGGDLRFLAQE